MLKSCFGLSPLRNGVNVVAVINMIFIFGTQFFRCLFHIQSYLHEIEEEIYWRSDALDHLDLNETQEIPTQDLKHKITTIISWKDNVFMSALIYFIWTILLLTTNICLKQSTYIPAPQKIYSWLVINYATLLCLVIHLVKYISLMKKATAYTILFRVYDDFVGNFIMNFLLVVIFTIEIIIVHSYYIEEQKAILNDVIQLKWKHVSKNHVLSQGTAYPSASTFKETISSQIQEGSSHSRIPPFVSNVFLNVLS